MSEPLTVLLTQPTAQGVLGSMFVLGAGGFEPPTPRLKEKSEAWLEVYPKELAEAKQWAVEAVERAGTACCAHGPHVGGGTIRARRRPPSPAIRLLAGCHVEARESR